MIDLVLVVLVSAVAAARVFRLLVVDDITYRLRNWVSRRSEWVQEGFHCPWCMGYWISLLFVVTGLLAMGVFTWWGVVAGGFAASYVQARLQDSETD
jgi:hypothetical protein